MPDTLTPVWEKMDLPSDANITGRDFGSAELELLQEVLASGVLNGTKGTMVKTLEQKFAQAYGVSCARTTTSGTASLHTAIAAINPEPGDEIITTPITDMGAITPILYQAAIPVFADVDPHTFNVTAETLAPRISRRTRAIIVTHLFGNPCDMDPIMDLARAHNIPVIEDACQAYFAEYKGRRVGTIGDIGCFSLQQGKHMSCGEGGLVVTNDRDWARRMVLFTDKAWGYGDPQPDHYFLALNYRMTELQAAVALAQLDKVQGVVSKRQATAHYFGTLIRDLPGIETPPVAPGSKHVYWKYPLRIDDRVIDGGVDTVSAFLKTHGIYSAPRYVQKPAFQCQVLRDRCTFGRSQFPYRSEYRRGEPEIVYDPADYPGTMDALAHILVLPWNEFYTVSHVEHIAGTLRRAVPQLVKSA